MTRSPRSSTSATAASSSSSPDPFATFLMQLDAYRCERRRRRHRTRHLHSERTQLPTHSVHRGSPTRHPKPSARLSAARPTGSAVRRATPRSSTSTALTPPACQRPTARTSEDTLRTPRTASNTEPCRRPAVTAGGRWEPQSAETHSRADGDGGDRPPLDQAGGRCISYGRSCPSVHGARRVGGRNGTGEQHGDNSGHP